MIVISDWELVIGNIRIGNLDWEWGLRIGTGDWGMGVEIGYRRFGIGD